MYRLAIYYLASLLLVAFLLSLAEVMPYNPWHILLSSLYIIAVSLIANLVFSKILSIRANTESAVITGLIIALITGPMSLTGNIFMLTFLAVVAMSSKYLFAWRKIHVFNPAAFAVVASALALGQGASWWVGNYHLMPVIIILGLAVLRKIKRVKLFTSFITAYLALFVLLNTQVVSSLDAAMGFVSSLYMVILPPILFFSFIMLTEPQTSPKTGALRIYYGVIVAVALIFYQTFLNIPYTLELALLTGNVFSFVVTRDSRLVLSLKNKEKLASNIYGFWFKTENKLSFKPGQFLEWTLYHKNPDNRGIRRYFTIASSPTEKNLLLAVKIPEKPSSFKQALLSLSAKEEIASKGAEGGFILPDKKDNKLAFIAGGIGITPFRSMVKYLMDKNINQDIVLIYSANSVDEFVFEDIFNEAQDKLKLKIVYNIKNKESIPGNWKGEAGVIDTEMIKKQIPDWRERIFYISGPERMVKSTEKTLNITGVENKNIKKDYFPGYEEI